MAMNIQRRDRLFITEEQSLILFPQGMTYDISKLVSFR